MEFNYENKVKEYNSRDYTKAELAQKLAGTEEKIHVTLRNCLIEAINKLDICSDGMEYVQEIFDLFYMDHPTKKITMVGEVSMFMQEPFDDDDVTFLIDGNDFEGDYIETIVEDK